MSWPWPEIPEPTFGLIEVPGPPTQDRLASQTGNITLAAGEVLRLLPGQHHISGRTWTLNGLPSQPVFVICEPGATIVDNAQLTIEGQYCIPYGLTFVGGARIRSRASYVGYRALELTGLPVSGSSRVMISPEAGHDVVIAYCHIHDNSAQPADVHGCKPATPGFQRLWYLNNHCHGNGGDSIQVGTEPLAEPWPQDIYIAGNLMHNEGENGIDMKKCRNVIAVDNEIYGMVATAGNDPGRGIVAHNGSADIQALRNKIHHCEGEGIVSTGATNLRFFGNEVRDCKYGVRAYSSSGEAAFNKAWNCETPFQFNIENGTVNHHDNLVNPPEGQVPAAPILSVELQEA